MARKPWLRIDADADQHPRIAELREGLKRAEADSACWAWITLLLAAKRGGSGEFRSEAHLKHALGGSYRWVERLRAVGLLEGLAVRDWTDYQRDQVDAERAKSWRAKRTRTFGERSRDENVRTDKDGDKDKDNPPISPPRGSATPQAIGALLKGLSGE